MCIFLKFSFILWFIIGLPGGSDGKESACNIEDPGSIPGWGRSPGERNSHPLQYTCLENSTDKGDQWSTLHSTGSQRVGYGLSD